MRKSIDRKSPIIINALKKAPIYKKQGVVNAKLAIDGEGLRTVMANGIYETFNVAKEGDWIITNQSGEQYIVSGNKFKNRYETTHEEGVFAAKGHCRAIANPFKVPISILASWGEEQNGDENCMIADTCDEKGNQDFEPYIIAAQAFLETYKLI